MYQNSNTVLMLYVGGLPLWRHGGLMVSVLIPRLSGPGLSPGQGHCVVFLGKILNSHSASPDPGV